MRDEDWLAVYFALDMPGTIDALNGMSLSRFRNVLKAVMGCEVTLQQALNMVPDYRAWLIKNNTR